MHERHELLVEQHEEVLAPTKKDGMVQTLARLEMKDASRNRVMWIIVAAIVGVSLKAVLINLGWL